MGKYEFEFNDRTYELLEDNFDYFANDEEYPVIGIDKNQIIALLNETEEINFDIEYYDKPCEKCKSGKTEKAKFFKFIECHFFIFTKDSNYIISNLSKEFKNTSVTHLFNSGKIDNSFIVSIAICENCGSYSIEIEQCEV